MQKKTARRKQLCTSQKISTTKSLLQNERRSESEEMFTLQEAQLIKKALIMIRAASLFSQLFHHFPSAEFAQPVSMPFRPQVRRFNQRPVFLSA